MNTGLRGGDLVRLRVAAIDFTNGYLNAHISKTKREQRIPMTLDLQSELRRWLRHYAEAMDMTVPDLPPAWRLVPPAHFVPLNVHHAGGPGLVQYRTDGRIRHPEVIVHRALEGLGYPTLGEGFHTLRRSAARIVLDAGKAQGDPTAIRAVQALLGHQQQATTERYLGVNADQLALEDLLKGRTIFGVKGPDD
jgi:integrase